MHSPSACTAADLSRLRRDFNIPHDLELTLPSKNYDVYVPPPGHLPIHVAAFEGGVRLPLHPTLRRALCAFGLAPMQLVPGFLRNLVGFLVLWREAAASRPNMGDPGYRELRSVFQLSPLTQQPAGQYYLRFVNAIDFVVSGTWRKDPGWKTEWVVVKGNWGTSVRYGHRECTVPTSFGPQPEWAKEED